MPIEQNSPKATAPQVATCVEVGSFEKITAKGKFVNHFYTMELEGKEFRLFEGKYFKAEKGDKFRPVVVIVPVAYNDKNGKAKMDDRPAVNWEKI